MNPPISISGEDVVGIYAFWSTNEHQEEMSWEKTAVKSTKIFTSVLNIAGWFVFSPCVGAVRMLGVALGKKLFSYSSDTQLKAEFQEFNKVQWSRALVEVVPVLFGANPLFISSILCIADISATPWLGTT